METPVAIRSLSVSEPTNEAPRSSASTHSQRARMNGAAEVTRTTRPFALIEGHPASRYHKNHP